jgi:hypothetical protein
MFVRRSRHRKKKHFFGLLLVSSVTAIGFLRTDVLFPLLFATIYPILAFRCQSSLPPRTFSTSQDIIWTMTINFDRWFDVSFLSIRTSGCRARLIVFTDTEHIFDHHFARVLEMTRAEVRRATLPPGRLLTDLVRFQWILSFLKTCQFKIDRLFMLDAHDIYFHKDPFEVLTSKDTMIFIEEGTKIKNDQYNTEWIDLCFGANGTRVKNQTIICAGTIYGPPHLFIKFAELVLARWPLPDCLWDQPIVNYLIYTGELAKVGIKTQSMDCNGPVLTLSSCSQSVKPVNGVLEGFNGKDEIPYVVHQWKQFEAFRDMYIDRCDMSEYMEQLQLHMGIDLKWKKPVRS